MDAIIEPPRARNPARPRFPRGRERRRLGRPRRWQSHRVPCVSRLAACERMRVAAHWMEAAVPHALGSRAPPSRCPPLLGWPAQGQRKKTRQERKRVANSGVRLRRVTGHEARAADWDFFNKCYRRTYREHRSTPYLTREFFGMLAARMPGNLLLVIAERDGEPIAAALDLFGRDALYGRYWGSSEHVPGLHFEACYYQAIEFCIERGIALSEGGAQGEHKHARGFLPEATRSFHWLAHPAFHRAVDEFLGEEGARISAYVDELNERTPFRRGDQVKG